MGTYLRTTKDNEKYAEDFLQYIEENKIPLTTEAMQRFNPPEEWRKEWKEFLNDRWEDKLTAFMSAGNANFMDLPTVQLKDLTKRWLNQAIQLEECIISSISPNRPIQEKHTFICTTCYDDVKGEGIYNTKRMPKKCEFCDSADNLIEDFDNPNNMEDTQWLRVQEVNRDSNTTKIPISVPIRVKGRNNLWQVGFNERIKPKGLLRFKPVKTKMGDMELTPWFEVFAIEKTSSVDEEIELTDKDRVRIRNEMKKDGYWKKVINSFCPWIYGQEVMKEVVLLGMGSMKSAMPLRILIVGDPSTGKSDILKAANMLPAQKHYAIMKQSRGTGLTVSAVRDPDTDQWTVEAGEFVYSDEWTLIIDEFQAGRAEDIMGLNSIIWDHELPYNLVGGLRGKFKARTALIFACNPQTGTMNETNIYVLLKFIGETALAAFISRMSFILYSKENETREFHEQVGGHIYDNSSDEVKKRKFWEDWYAENKVIEQSTATMRLLGLEPIKVEVPDVTSEKRYGIKTLQKILKYITEEVKIEEPPRGLREKFKQYYVDKRMDATERVNKIVTPRYMIHLLGIAQNIARWHGRTQLNESDMEYAFDLMFHHMTLVATDPNTGEVDAQSINGNIPEWKQKEIELEMVAKRGKDYQFEWACNKAMALHEDGYFMRDELLEFLKLIPRGGWQYKSSEINRRIEGGVMLGSMKTDNNGRFKWQPLKSQLV